MTAQLDAATAILLMARLTLAAFLVPSGIRKLRHQQRFAQGVLDYRVLPTSLARPIGYVLPWTELALGVALILGIALPVAAVAASVLVVSFIAAVTVNLRRGRQIACNCYGIAGTATIGLGTLARNGLLSGLTIIVFALSWRVDQTPPTRLTGYFFDNVTVTAQPPTTTMLLALLVACCVVVVYLAEWGTDIYVRVSQLRNLPRTDTSVNAASRRGR